MADLEYNSGLDEWRTFAIDTIRALLLKGSGYTPNKDHDFVDDVVPASNECALAGYSRPTLTNCTRVITDASDRIVYDADDPDFGPIIAGDTITGMILYKFQSNDGDSILLAYYDLPDTATNGTPFIPAIHASGLRYHDSP